MDNAQRISGFADMTPSQRVMAMTGRVFTTTDLNGRVIKFRSLKAIERMRLKRMAGADASNDAFMQDVYDAASITMLGDDPITFPNSVRECEAIMMRLEDVGLAAIAEFNIELFKDAPQTADEAAAQTVADAKN